VQVLPARLFRDLPADAVRRYLLAGLQQRLYTDFYCRGFATRPPVMRHEPALDGRTPFIEQLSAANHGKGLWQDNGPGSGAWVRLPKELLRLSPGFYVAVGDRDFPEDIESRLWRFYWHLVPQGAVRLMSITTAMLNREGVPFRMKVVADPDHYGRHDSAVLYLDSREWRPAVARVLAEIYRRVKPLLQQGIPALTKPLAPGVGWAEQPESHDSFGWHRCGLIADGLLCSREQRARSLEAVVATVEERFLQEDVSVEAPYLRSCSSEEADFTPAFDTSACIRAAASRRPSPRSRYARTALQIAGKICSEAIWDESRCTWIGAEPIDIRAPISDSGVRYRTLVSDVYDGTAGVALFLAQLFRATGNTEARKTACGAMRQSLARVEGCPPAVRLGFYSGSLGIALASACVGCAIGERSLLEEADALAARVVDEYSHETSCDVISGKAGGVLAALGLAHLSFAMRLGDELIDQAERDESGWSWRGSSLSSGENLTGLAHGAAGVGLAMTELFAATGKERYAEAARRAFDYERSLYNPAACNWPDLRRMPGRRRKSHRFMTAWCHGAAGIALTRARAFRVFGDEVLRSEALTALDATRQAVRHSLETGAPDFSLCHGLCGNVEILICAGGLSGEDNSSDATLIASVAATGIRLYFGHGEQWPCGGGCDSTPGLMLGLAGIGQFYLRLAHPAIPSPLMPSSFLRSTSTLISRWNCS
jgi:hypothetical protein